MYLSLCLSIYLSVCLTYRTGLKSDRMFWFGKPGALPNNAMSYGQIWNRQFHKSVNNGMRCWSSWQIRWPQRMIKQVQPQCYQCCQLPTPAKLQKHAFLLKVCGSGSKPFMVKGPTWKRNTNWKRAGRQENRSEARSFNQTKQYMMGCCFTGLSFFLTVLPPPTIQWAALFAQNLQNGIRKNIQYRTQRKMC